MAGRTAPTIRSSTRRTPRWWFAETSGNTPIRARSRPSRHRGSARANSGPRSAGWTTFTVTATWSAAASGWRATLPANNLAAAGFFSPRFGFLPAGVLLVRGGRRREQIPLGWQKRVVPRLGRQRAEQAIDEPVQGRGVGDLGKVSVGASRAADLHIGGLGRGGEEQHRQPVE